MPSDLFNQDDPRNWSEDRRREEFRSFRQDEVVGDHCQNCQYEPEPVIHRGTIETDLMVVGDYTAPEDQETNRPFSGPAGDLLAEMLAAIDRDWETDCYVTNALLCDGTDESPRKPSVDACRTNLTRQMDIVGPDVVFCVGAFALQSLLHEPASVTLRDHLGHRENVPGYPDVDAVISFNPAYVLRQPEGDRRRRLKEVIWGHLKKVRTLLDAPDE